MPRTQTILQILVASPEDVAEERGVLEQVIRELNTTWADTLGIRLDLIRWETHAAPGFGDDAQDVINQQIPDSYDVFIGIMWTRFGTPTKRAGSGTEEEFTRAYDRHRDDPDSVKIMFYFKDAPVSPSEIDPAQLGAISEFKSRLGDLGGLYSQFKSTDEFRNSTRLHLSRIVQNWIGRLGQKGKNRRVVTEQKALGAATRASGEEEEEGFLDLIETAVDSMTKVSEVLARMTEIPQDLGDKFTTRADEASRLVTPGGPLDLKAAKRMASNAAHDLETFVTRMNVEIPLFSESFAISMDSYGRAAVLMSDFGIDNTQHLQGALDTVAAFRPAMTEARDTIVSFREVIAKMPRMTSVFNRARRNTLATLDRLVDQLEAGNRQAHDVEILLLELIEQCERNDGV